MIFSQVLSKRITGDSLLGHAISKGVNDPGKEKENEEAREFSEHRPGTRS